MPSTTHPWFFLLPLLAGFALNAASASTSAFSLRWGLRGGRAATFFLRNVLGIPLWVTGLVLAARTPAPYLLAASLLPEAFGWLLAVAGSALVIWALAALRWRAAAPAVTDALAATGPYAYVRHPLYDGVMLQLAGPCLLLPRWPVLLACALSVAWILLQARLEERDLSQRVGGYRAYAARVPRFVPRPRG